MILSAMEWATPRFHLVPAGLVGPAALGVLAGQDAGLLVAEGAGAGGGFQEVGEGHGACLSLEGRTLESGSVLLN